MAKALLKSKSSDIIVRQKACAASSARLLPFGRNSSLVLDFAINRSDMTQPNDLQHLERLTGCTL